MLSGCDLVYENNQRWLVTTTISDQYGKPVAAVPVNVIASNFSDRDLIGVNTTDKNGVAKVRSIVPINAREYVIEINLTDQEIQRFNTTFSSLRLIGPLDEVDVLNINKNDMILELGQIEVNQLAILAVNIDNISNSLDTLYWELTTRPVHIEIQIIDPEVAFKKSKTRGRFLPTNDPLSLSLPVVDNDTIIFDYRLINGAVTRSGQEMILMDTEDLTYVFQF